MLAARCRRRGDGGVAAADCLVAAARQHHLVGAEAAGAGPTTRLATRILGLQQGASTRLDNGAYILHADAIAATRKG